MRISGNQRVWLLAYCLVCLWYFLNLLFGSGITYYFFSPQPEEFLHGLYLFLFYTAYIGIVWLLTHILFKYPILPQVLGQFVGLTLGFLAVSYCLFELSVQFDNRTADTFAEYLLGSHSGTKVTGKMDAFRIYNEYVALVFMAYSIRYAQRLKLREQEKTALQVRNKDMQMALLKSQINPHFLFNTLNSISTLVGNNKDKARKTISRLSSVMRYLLETIENQSISLAEELTFVDHYLNIQLVRFEGVFDVSKNIDETCLQTSVPPLALQMLLENAIKHGAGRRNSGGLISIEVIRSDDFVVVSVEDNGPGDAQSPPLPSTGIGLKNTELRLQGIYGQKAQLLAITLENGGFRASLRMPVQ